MTEQLRTVNTRLFAVAARIFISVIARAFGIEDGVSSAAGLTLMTIGGDTHV